MFNPLFIIPLLQCSFIFFTIVSGGIFFKEFNAFDLSQWMGFWFGIVVMFAGLVLLTPKPKSSKDDELHRALVNLPGIEDARVWEPEPATVYFWKH